MYIEIVIEFIRKIIECGSHIGKTFTVELFKKIK